ncbi:CDP-glycerol glycerophosphotransferase family protein [Paucisalibacillus globulus]|uniref:CDP-glycerol glycerophosphotransferase family protein n=1 Tax=Paucisalibacillus globulus TaxID=351095 RepID=UPI000479E446|nr:CDP-glycerol glycerophosphotransferase family protein [Paucisalibacillus globulus]
MMREVFITIYLFSFWVVFSICKLFPLQSKTTFVTAFGDNVFYTLHAFEKELDQPCVIIQSNFCRVDLSKENREVICYRTRNPLKWIRAVYHIATSEKIFIDTYFAFLSVSNFKPSVICTQLWHAVGAMKKFGLEDHSVKHRSKTAKRRFKEVYKRFDFVVIGSENMKVIFKRAFGINDNQLIRTGVPRTDFFFNEDEKSHAIQKMKEEFPIMEDKKVLLYAPTYRDNQFVVSDLALELPKMQEKLGEEYVLFLSLHPAVKMKFHNHYADFVFDVSDYHINHISLVSDILITDYSSIPFEFAILHKPIIFFAYDLDKYEEDRGLWDKYENLVPGPIAKSTDELIHIIQYNEFDIEKLIQFGDEWNRYSTGNSSERLIKAIYGNEK